MWISRKTDYAARAMLALSISHGETMTADELAQRTDVPEAFLRQILVQMRDGGFIRSVRGPSGGYRLNHSPEEITLERIVRLFQGPLAPIPCATRSEPEPCSMAQGCAMQMVWADIREPTISILERMTFADLATRSSGRWEPVGRVLH